MVESRSPNVPLLASFYPQVATHSLLRRNQDAEVPTAPRLNGRGRRGGGGGGEIMIGRRRREEDVPYEGQRRRMCGVCVCSYVAL